jgi:uncharacterized membrane protein
MTTAPLPQKTSRLHRQLQRWRRRPRFIIAALVCAITIVVASRCGMPPVQALLCGFDLGAVLFLIALAHMFEHATPQSMCLRARLEDGGPWGFLLGNVVFSAIVLVALGLELKLTSAGSLFGILLAAGSLLLSWLFLNTMFALHYAHGYYGYYGDHEGARHGLDFPGTKEPDYWDFVYFAITIGMTFQVSDVQICDRRMRRLAMVHGVVAFFFNVIIVALTVNLVAGKAG